MIFLLPVFLMFHILLLSRLTFTAWPEMLSYPYLLSNGFTLYKDYIMPYPPTLILLLQGLFSTFGFTPEVLKIFTWVVILAVDLGVFYLLKKVGKSFRVALVFLLGFMVLQSFLDGNMLWFDFASELAIIPAFIFLLQWSEKEKFSSLFWTAVFLVLASTIKQTALIYLPVLGLVLLFSRRFFLRNILTVTLGFGSILLPLLLYFMVSQSLHEFFQWTILYPLAEWPKFPGYVQMTLNLKQLILLGILLAPIGGVILSFYKLWTDKVVKITLLFLAAALVATYPRFSYFHLQPILPFLFIFSTRVYILMPQKFKVSYGMLLAGIMLVVSLSVGPKDLGTKIRFYEEGDKKIAARVIEETGMQDRVFLQGVYSSIYVYSHRLPPKNWSDNFGWYLEIPGVQEWVLAGFNEQMPDKIFWRTPSKGRWYELGSYQPAKITEFIRQNYRQTGKIGGVEIWSKKY